MSNIFNLQTRVQSYCWPVLRYAVVYASMWIWNPSSVNHYNMISSEGLHVLFCMFGPCCGLHMVNHGNLVLPILHSLSRATTFVSHGSRHRNRGFYSSWAGPFARLARVNSWCRASFYTGFGSLEYSKSVNNHGGKRWSAHRQPLSCLCPSRVDVGLLLLMLVISGKLEHTDRMQKTRKKG